MLNNRYHYNIHIVMRYPSKLSENTCFVIYHCTYLSEGLLWSSSNKYVQKLFSILGILFSWGSSQKWMCEHLDGKLGVSLGREIIGPWVFSCWNRKNEWDHLARWHGRRKVKGRILKILIFKDLRMNNCMWDHTYLIPGR